MGLSAAARSAAQSFDRSAAGYDRLGDLLFPGCQLERLGGAVVGLTWKAAASNARKSQRMRP